MADLTDTELLEFQNRRRVQVCPEFESCWHALVYGESDQPEATYTANTPREALAKAAAGEAPRWCDHVAAERAKVLAHGVASPRS